MVVAILRVCTRRTQRTFGAVGFINDATDTQEHRRKAEGKFIEDLARATAIGTSEPDSAPEVFCLLYECWLDSYHYRRSQKDGIQSQY